MVPEYSGVERSGGVGRLRCGEGGDVRFGLAWRLGRGEERRGLVRRGEAWRLG